MKRIAVLVCVLAMAFAVACQDQGPELPTGEATPQDGDQIVERTSLLDGMKSAPSLKDSVQKDLGSCALNPGPDLKIVGHSSNATSFEPYAQNIHVKNVGNVEAVFSKKASLLSNAAGGNANIVPAGGKIPPGATKTTRGYVKFLCDFAGNTLDADEWVGQSREWKPAEWTAPDPVLPSGLRPLYVDPFEAVEECDETNNTYIVKIPNPVKAAGGIKGTGLPDLTVTDVTWSLVTKSSTTKVHSTVKWRNQGTRTALFCALEKAPHYYLEISKIMPAGEEQPSGTFAGPLGSNYPRPLVIHPGASFETKMYILQVAKPPTEDSWGVVTTYPGLQPGCHEIKAVIDPGNEIEESNECNNTAVFYVAVGGETCPPDKQTHAINTCLSKKKLLDSTKPPVRPTTR